MTALGLAGFEGSTKLAARHPGAPARPIHVGDHAGMPTGAHASNYPTDTET
jgi:hypothetical protein